MKPLALRILLAICLAVAIYAVTWAAVNALSLRTAYSPGEFGSSDVINKR